MKKIHPFTTILLVCSCLNVYSQQTGYKFQQTSLPLEERLEDLLNRLTLEEKVKLCYGNVTDNTADRFNSGGIARLNIKQIEMLDGPVGVRNFNDNQKTTALPSTLLLSCTWDINSARRYGEVMASEMLSLGKHVVFGPGMNLMRSPLCGRNFEYMGEDPFLTGSMAANYINGIQSMGVAACAKHYLANEIDNLRHYTSSNMDERTMHEIYLLPFEMAIKEGKVWVIMTANSLFNGIHVTENKTVLQNILRDEFNYDGVILTDWRAAYNTINTANAGTDMTTGFCAYVFGEDRLLNAVKNGEISEQLINAKVKNILRLYFRTGVMNEDNCLVGSINTDEHKREARKLATEGMVLLKNTANLLPINPEKIKNILVTGPGVTVVPSGTGSSKVISEISVTPLQGLKSAFKNCNINYVSYGSSKINLLLSNAKSNDIVLFFALGGQCGESRDLKNIELPDNQATIINKLSDNNKKVVVITLSGSVIAMDSWSNKVGAILLCCYAGQSTGDAIADVLSGKVNPGGKLSYTIANKLEDYACHYLGLWPQKAHAENIVPILPKAGSERKAIYAYDCDYKEGVFMGYRWFDQKGIEPLFPFGYGLSYTSFLIEKSGIDIISNKTDKTKVQVKIKISNTGTREGSEVIQLYIGETNCSVPRPPKELKGFQKVFLNTGEKKEITIPLDFRSFAFWSNEKNNWELEPGKYTIYVGNSSRNIAFEESIILK